MNKFNLLPAIFGKTIILILAICLPQGIMSQSFFKTYPELSSSFFYNLDETQTGFEMELESFSAFSSEIFQRGASDANGNLINSENLDFPGGRPIFHLSDGNYLRPYVDAANHQVVYERLNTTGGVINSFTFDFPMGNVATSGHSDEFADGDIFISYYYGNDLVTPSTLEKRTIVYAKVNPDTGAVDWENSFQSVFNEFRALPYLIKVAPDGSVFMGVHEEIPTSVNNFVYKISPDGDMLWGLEVSDLERFPVQYVPTVDGGLWMIYNQIIESVERINADGTKAGSILLHSTFNGGAQPTAIAPAPNNGVMAAGTVKPNGANQKSMYTAIINTDFNILKTNLLEDLPYLPQPHAGIQLSNGEYVFTGSFGGTLNPSFHTESFLVKLNENGEYQPGGGFSCSNSPIFNPGFENGLQSWTDFGAAGLSNDAFAGSQALKLCPVPNGDNRVLQGLPATAGHEYTLQHYGKREAAGSGVLSSYLKFLDASFQPITGLFAVSINALDWTKYQNTAIAPANTAYIEIGFGSSLATTDCAFIDEVCLSENSSAACSLTTSVSNVQCNDEGTPNDPADDTFTFDLLVEGTNTSSNQWVAASFFQPVYGEFGVPKTMGSFFTNNNTFNIFINDVDDGTCFTNFDFTPPPPCSNGGGLPDLTPQFTTATTNSVQVGEGFGLSFNVVNVDQPLAPNQLPFKAQLYFSSDQFVSANDIPVGGQLTLGLGQASTGGTVPLDTPPGTYFALVKIDDDEQITESNEANNIGAPQQLITVVTGGGGGDIDLELVLFQQNPTPTQWANYTVKATLSNMGGSTATGVRVSLSKPNGVVYTGGDEYDASQGSFSPFGNENWEVGNIPAGGFATLTVNYFLLASEAPVAYAEVSAANELDGDSTPGNGNPPTPNEDDEASTGGGGPPNLQPDLTVNNLVIPNSTVMAGEVLNYNFDLSNIGDGASPGNFLVKAYISIDPQISPDDVQDGIIPTGNYGAGLVVQDVPGASTIPAGLAPGAYYLILRVDADEQVAESNENNNEWGGLISVTAPVDPGDGCGFLKSYDFQVTGPSGASNYRRFGGENASGYQYIEKCDNLNTDETRTIILETDLAGIQVNFTDSSVPTPQFDAVVATTSFNEPGEITVQRTTPSGMVVWSNVFQLNIGGTIDGTALNFGNLPEINGGYFITGTVVLNGATNFVPFVIKIDDMGNVLVQNYFPNENDVHSLFYEFPSGDGGHYFRKFRINSFELAKVDGDGAFLWQKPIASDLPSTQVTHLEKSLDESAVYVAVTDNLNGRVTKFSSNDGSVIWGKLDRDIFSPGGPFTFQQFVNDMVPTFDGGLVFGFSFTEPGDPSSGYEYGKVDALGNPLWSHIISDEWDFKAELQTSDGGFLFIGVKGFQDYAMMKTTTTGQLVPACDNGGSGNGEIDLSLHMETSNPSPAIYSSTEITLMLNNDGPETATGIVVDFQRPNGTVYTGGNEWTSTQGSFNPFGNERWTVGSIAAGGSASITVSYFLLTANNLRPYAQVIATNETDVDSTPNNGTCCTPNEDDEASINLNNFTGNPNNFLLTEDLKGRPVQLKSIHPNPVYFGEMTVTILSKLEGEFDLEIYDLFGRKAIMQKVALEVGRNEIPMDVSILESGTYYLNMPGQSWNYMPLRFVVARW